MLGSFRSNVTVGIAVLVGIAGLSYVLAGAAAPPGGTTAAVEFTPGAKMKRPEGYREWIYIGTPLTPIDMSGGDAPFPEFHAVYIDRESFAHFKKTGEFRDGTVLVEDLVNVGSKEAFAAAGEVRKEAHAKARPRCASDLIGVSRLAFPEQLIEIVFKAVLPPAETGGGALSIDGSAVAPPKQTEV